MMIYQTRRVPIWLGLLGFLLIVTGCQGLFPPSAYPPPPAPPPVAAPPPPSRPLLYVNASRLNLRACPGMDCPKVATLERNEEVEQVAQAEDWVQVRVRRDGSIGWVASRYLSDRPAPMEMAPATPEPEMEPQVPERARPEQPPATSRPEPPKPAKTYLPRPAPKPAEAAEPEPEPVPVEPGPVRQSPAPAEPAPVEKPAPVQPEPQPEPPRRIRIM
ncbi:MAG: SH3 domain-containing protein [Deltaproteobacteria bacterium]|nr:SH3 domain-containing protein [Deltaproteobacteria bacterium]